MIRSLLAENSSWQARNGASCYKALRQVESEAEKCNVEEAYGKVLQILNLQNNRKLKEWYSAVVVLSKCGYFLSFMKRE